MKVYEEYNTEAEKRRIVKQTGVKRYQSTQYARCYLIVFDEDGDFAPNRPGVYNALGEIQSNMELGDSPKMISSAEVAKLHLEICCRRVMFDTIPDEWQRAFVLDLWNRCRDPYVWNDPINRKIRQLVRRKNKELNLGLNVPKKLMTPVP